VSAHRSVLLLLPNDRETRITADQARELRKTKSVEVIRQEPYTLLLLPDVQKWGRFSNIPNGGAVVMNGALLQAPRRFGR
jgi:hypothetical protein